MKEPAGAKFGEKLQEELFEQKMVYEALRRQLDEVKQEQKQKRDIQQAQMKKTNDMENTIKEHL